MPTAHAEETFEEAGSGAPMSSSGAQKVAPVTVAFWIIKILSTGMGETTSDFLVRRFDPVPVVLLSGVALAAVLVLQLAVRRYDAWRYWIAVVMVSVFGTMAADVIHIVFGVPYLASTIFFAAALALILATWRKFEGSLSIHSVNTFRRELFYWATVLTTFALGTAAGDMTATTLSLGYFASGVVFACVIVVPLIGFLAFRMNAVFAFWFAYVVTRPLGASFADWMGVPPSRGGLDWGTGPVSLVLAIVILGLVAWVARAQYDEKGDFAVKQRSA
ncbi:MAG: hypothetical protein P4M09_01590 [Devosia sp.]|nr:hypothetical protein [Devosia sp.]